MVDQKEMAAAAKEWLMRSMGAQRYRRSLERRLKAFTFASITRYENDGTGKGTPKENEQESKMLEYSELRGMIERISLDLDNIDLETIRVVNRIESKTEKAILIDRYVNLMTWDEIGTVTGFSRSHAQRIHGKALLDMYGALLEAGYAV